MSLTDAKVNASDSDDTLQGPFFLRRDQNIDISPQHLSGEEQGDQNFFERSIQNNKSNFSLTVILIIKTIIGTGILGLPYAVSKCGLLFAIIIFVFATAAIQFSSSLLLKAKNLSGHSNYSTILYHIFNHKLSKALGSLLIFLSNLGTCIAQIIIFKRTIRQNLFQPLLRGNTIIDQFYFSEYMIVIIIALLEVPFTLVKRIERLKFMALIGVIGIIVFIITFVVYYGVTVSNSEAPSQEMNLFPSDWFAAAAAIPNFLMALTFHINFFPIFKGMKKSNDHRMKMASLVGLTICAAWYLLIGILGYSLIGSQVEGNFLLSIDYDLSNKVIYYIINCGFLLSIFFAFPIIFFGCRNNFMALIKLAVEESPAAEENSINQLMDESQVKNTKQKENLKFLLYTFFIYLVIIGVGILVEDIELVFNGIGAICSSSIGMLLPTYFYFTLVIKNKQKRNMNFYLAIGMFVVMVPFAIFAVIAQYAHF